eukprot:TRINITY_DN22228_c0_g1_i1.p1 TRINITY_DN22228_c0_g1~~TRINITY_DN22228_c0_g1_i1.p1  ORF type:complete len:171 (-),score=28.23 TRINITY_DN22228_c0_g1_i1:472-984(-)
MAEGTSTACNMQSFLICTLDGHVCAAEVPDPWTVLALKMSIEEETQTPCYKQALLIDGRVLRNSERLTSDLTSGDASNLCLVRVWVPECLHERTIRSAWQAFLTLSDDGGDAIRCETLKDMVRLIGWFATSEQLREYIGSDGSRRLSFEDVLDVLARWKGTFDDIDAALL